MSKIDVLLTRLTNIITEKHDKLVTITKKTDQQYE